MNATRGIVWSILGAAALATIVLPSPRDEDRSPHNELNMRVSSASARLSAQIELWRIADSRALAREAARATASSREPIAFGPPPSGAAGFAQNIRQFVAAEAERMPRRDTTVRIVVAFALDTGSITGIGEIGRAGSAWSVDAFVPRSDSSPTCAVVARVHWPSSLVAQDSVRMRQHGGRVLGPCAWYGAYGQPGRGVAAWLDSTGHGAFVHASHSPWPSLRTRRWSNRTGLYIWELDYGPIIACIAKRAAACEQLVLRPRFRNERMSRNFDFTRTDGLSLGRHWYASMSEMTGVLLDELEREVGPDGFLTFWRSDLPLPEAFAAARGEPMHVWVSRKLTAIYAPYAPGPLPRPRTALALLIALPGSVALGLYAVRKRTTFA